METLRRREFLALGAAGPVAATSTWTVAPAVAKTAAAVPATIDVDNATNIPVQSGLVGYNVHITNRAYHFTDDATVRWSNSSSRAGDAGRQVPRTTS
jgi:hypothetical protein